MKMRYTLLVSAVLALASPLALAQDDGSDLTFDGLAPIKKSNFRQAWADPDIDFTKYNKVILGNAQFEFRAVKKSSGRSSIRRGNETEFWIDEKDRETLVEVVTGIFREEIESAKGWEIVEERGPDTLVLVGALHDIVSHVPPELMGAGEIYLRSVGEATLIIEARDSMSGETIYRAVDRREAGRHGDAINANRVTTWSEVRRWARRWASRLRAGLESIHK